MFSSIRLRPSSRATALSAVALMVASGTLVAGGAQAAKPGNSPNAKACQKGGWDDFIRSEDHREFSSEQECTSYAARGGTLVMKSSAQRLCESYGGTFSDRVPGNATFNCLGWSAASAEEFAERVEALREECFSFWGNAWTNSEPEGFPASDIYSSCALIG